MRKISTADTLAGSRSSVGSSGGHSDTTSSSPSSPTDHTFNALPAAAAVAAASVPPMHAATADNAAAYSTNTRRLFIPYSCNNNTFGNILSCIWLKRVFNVFIFFQRLTFLISNTKTEVLPIKY